MATYSRLIFLFCLGWLAFPSIASTNHTDVAVTFLRDSGQPWVNPEIGAPLNHPALPAWKVDASTKLRFRFTSSTNSGGNLVIVLKNKKAAEITPGQPNPDPPSQINTYKEYMRVAIPLNQTGITHEVVLGNHINTTGLGWNQEIYLGIFAEVSDSSTVYAFANNQHVGVPVSHILEITPPFNLGVLYDNGQVHVNLPDPDVSAGTQGHAFTDLGETLINRTVHGAISHYTYEVTDATTLPVGVPSYALDGRIWELFRIETNNLILEETIAGEGDLDKSCHFQAPENLTSTGKRYLLLCRTVDALGHANIPQPTTLSDPNLGDNSFIFEVGRDVTQNPDNCLAISHLNLIANPSVTTIPVCGVDELNNGRIYVMPHSSGSQSDFDTSPSTQETFTIRWKDRSSFIRYSLPKTIEPIPTTVVSEIYDWPQIGTNASTLPVYIEWQYENRYGTTVFSAPHTITYKEPVPPPFVTSLTDVDWVSLPSNPASGTPFNVTYRAGIPQNNDIVIATAWIYQIENGQIVNSALVKSPSGDDCFQLTASNSMQTLGLALPPAIDQWNLSAGGELKIRIKAEWRSDTLCTANFLNDFSVLPNNNEIYAMAESSSWLIGGATPGQFNSLIQQGSTAYVDPVFGDVQLLFEETHTGNPDEDLAWRWETSDGLYLWLDGSWQATSNHQDTWVNLGSGTHAGGTDTFSSRWQWLRSGGEGVIKPKSTGNGSSSPPFADDGPTNLVNAFFTPPGAPALLDDLTVRVRVRMGFDARFEEKALSVNLSLLQPDPGIQSFTFEISENNQVPTCSSTNATEWMEAGGLMGRLGQLPHIRFTLTTPGHLPSVVTMRLEKRLANGAWGSETCLNPDVGYFSSNCDNNPGIGEDLVRRWVASSSSPLFSTLANSGPGEYRFTFTTASCGTPAESTAQVQFKLNPEESFALRFHYRDHLGSSTLSRAYSPSITPETEGLTPFQLKLNASGSNLLTLYPQTAQKTNFDPFGRNLSDVASSEPNPRYTDHEFDAESGFNYMKGRFQLASYAKFNRPDPMRDWDWENPSSINLYQYARNSPINFMDPNGFTITEDILKSATEDVNKGGFWNKVKGYAKFAGAVAWEGLGAAATNELAEKHFEGEDIGLMDVVAAAGDLPGLKQGKVAVKGGQAIGQGIKAGSDLIGDKLQKQLVKKTDDAATMANKKAVGPTQKTGCFVAGTMVLTYDGYRPIEEISAGDWVWSKDEETGETNWKPVVRTFITFPDALVTLTYEADDKTHQIVGTTDHPFWLAETGRFEEMGKLKLGDRLFTTKGADAVVIGLRLQVASRMSTFKTYNFEVADYHTYFVAESHLSEHSVWVHNNDCAPKGRGKNNLKPDPNATGPHSTFKRNPDGKLTGHAEWKPNSKNPTGFDQVKRVDTQHANPHTHVNKVTGKEVPTPHTHDKSVPGGVRPSKPTELPKK